MQRDFQRTSLTPPAPPVVVRQLLAACACLLVWLLPPPWALSQDKAGPARVENVDAGEAAPSEPPAQALEHYQRGRELYQAGRYREALQELEQALALDPDSPNLVYNVARVHELLGEIDLAIQHYIRYQKLLPPEQTEEIARVESTLQRLAGARAQVAPEPPSAGSGPAAPKRERGVADAAFWTLTASAAAALAAGGTVGVLALQADRDAEKFTIGQDGDVHERDELVTRADRMALASDLTLLAGATLGVTAILLFALRTKPAREAKLPAPRAVVELGACSGGAILSFRGRL